VMRGLAGGGGGLGSGGRDEPATGVSEDQRAGMERRKIIELTGRSFFGLSCSFTADTEMGDHETRWRNKEGGPTYQEYPAERQ